MTLELGIWEIAVLALLREAPMHPYQMQRLLRMRHKDDILVLKRGSLYHAIGRLLRADLIAVESTTREGNRPERTVYRIVPAGLQAFTSTLQRIVAVPRRESSEFMAAMSFLVHLDPQEAALRMQERMRVLEREIARLRAGLAAASAHVDRINLIENEYLLAMQSAELTWIRGLEAEIRSGTLTWNIEAILRNVKAERDAAAERKK